MNLVLRGKLRCVLATMLFGLLSFGVGVESGARPIPEALHQPAGVSPGATASVLLGISRAGAGLVAVGEHGYVLRSDDAGRTWRQAASPTSVTLVRVCFANAEEGWAVGHMGVVLRSTDGGSSWQMVLDGIKAAQLVLARAQSPVESQADRRPDLQRTGYDPYSLESAQQLVQDGPDKPFLTLLVSSRLEVMVAGAYGLVFDSEDGGATWRPAADRFDNPNTFHYYGLARAGSVTFAAGEQGMLLRSNSGGRFVPTGPAVKGTYFGILATSSGGAYVYGLRGALFFSADGLRDWRRVSSDASLSFTAGAVLPDGRVILGNQTGQILTPSDDGKSFKTIASAGEPIADLAVASDGVVVVVGPRGAVRVPLNVPASK